MFIFIDDEPEQALPTRMMFFRMGIHTLYHDTGSLLDVGLLPVQGIVIMRPEVIEDLEDVCHKIRYVFPRIPLAMMYHPQNGNYYLYHRLADAVFEENITTVTFANKIFDIYEEQMHRSARIHFYNGIKTVVGAHNISVFGEGLPASHEQRLLVRYLLLRAPSPVKPEELRRTCFRPDRLPAVSNVHTQFCRINQLYRQAFEKTIFLYHKDYGFFIAPR